MSTVTQRNLSIVGPTENVQLRLSKNLMRKTLNYHWFVLPSRSRVCRVQ